MFCTAALPKEQRSPNLVILNDVMESLFPFHDPPLKLPHLFLLLFFTLSAGAQPPDTLWTRTYGGDLRDVFYSVAPTPDGGFILAGGTWSFGSGSQDVYAVKTDSLGNVEWSHAWGGAYSDVANKVVVLDDGYLLSGWINNAWPIPPEPSEGWLLRLDLNGDTLWTKRHGRYEGGYTWFNDVIRTQDGGFLAAGRSNHSGTPDLWLMKTNSLGDSVWSRSYGGQGWELAWQLVQTPDDNFVITGYSSSFGAGAYDMWLLKVNASGDSLWSRTFGGASWEEARALALAPDGGFLLAGYNATVSYPNDDAWVVKTDSLGNYQWDRSFPGGVQMWLYAILPTPDGGYIGAGMDNPGSGGTALWVVRGDSTGDSMWTHRWNYQHISNAFDMSAVPTGGYILAGQARYQQNDSTGDGWLIRMSAEPNAVPNVSPAIPSVFAVSVHPNPFNSATTLTFTIPAAVHELNLEVHNLMGQTVLTKRISVTPGTFTYPFDASNLPTGLYFLSAHAGPSHLTQKLLLLR